MSISSNVWHERAEAHEAGGHSRLIRRPHHAHPDPTPVLRPACSPPASASGRCSPPHGPIPPGSDLSARSTLRHNEEFPVASLPSVSYSITVRLEIDGRASAVSSLTNAVERVGGAVTALDVNSSGRERLRIDVTCAARDTNHAQAIVEALDAVEASPSTRSRPRSSCTWAARSRCGRGAAAQPRRALHGLPGVAGLRGNRGQPGGCPTPHRQTQQRGRGHRRFSGARPGQYRPRSGTASRGSKAALFKRFADIDAWPIALDTQDTDEIVRAVQLIARGSAVSTWKIFLLPAALK